MRMDGQVAFRPVETAEDIDLLASLAQRIWTEHYTPLLGPGQVAYMVERFQSPGAVAAQIRDDNYRYYLLEMAGTPAGYIGIRPEGDRLFLSKLYVDKAYRRQGIAACALAFLIDQCRREGIGVIWLTVNRHNAGSIAAYERMGFRTVRTQVADIGGGYVMDDYIMEKIVD